VDIAALVNVKARRGSEAVARTLHAELPGARVRVSRSLADAQEFAREMVEDPPELMLAAGGDGTAVALLNALRTQVQKDGGPVVDDGAVRTFSPAIGVLPLGTGNGWAHATGAAGWKTALRELGRARRNNVPLRFRRFDLVETCGVLGHFAGTGWDAELIDDFHAQKEGWSLLSDRARGGLAGYLNGLLTRTAPRHFFQDRVEVEVVNTGEDALGVDAEGRPFRMPGGEHGKVLYRGPTSVCAAGTSEEWGFRFRAFPFAELVRGRMCFRNYAGTAAQGLMRAHRLWKGEHPLEGMSTWLTTRVRATFSRPVPFQIGGDRLGHRDQVEYSVAPFEVEVLDWSKLS
jgi:diacylglycerol kinase family enzyme